MKVDTTKFANQNDLFDYLIKNKKELAEFKKASVKFADCFGTSPMQIAVSKALNTSHKDDPSTGTVKRTIIGNTYNWMDSHDDVHADGVFAVSIKERADKIWHLHDHEYKLTSKVGIPEKIYEKSVDWTDLGINKVGSTQALFMDSLIKRSLNEPMYESYKDGQIDQHSVGMIYVKLDLAVNDPKYKEEYAAWSKYIDGLGNKEKAVEKGFFWVIKEAKLKEISAVLEGSNELTPTIQNIESPKDAQHKGDPEKSSQAAIDYDFLTKNLNLKS